ncbi:MAG TPA: phosphoribosylaminoimidazolesuccinocarboxamide synthase, partial [Bacteroidales bacterium]|nr:phosphoribosylaminoimidazolesuccinocarboxamide synthase [Bacteroidales bacterium]
FIEQISARYIELFERITGKEFVKADTTDPLKRINDNVSSFLKGL